MLPPGESFSTPMSPEGTQHRVRIIAPGEPVEHEGRFAAMAYLGGFVARGWRPEADTAQWVVLVERQRGPWRGFDVVHLQAFWDPQKAAKHYAVVKADVEAGHPIGAV
jgi:hypothetical protein